MWGLLLLGIFSLPIQTPTMDVVGQRFMSPDRTGQLWGPVLEWSLSHPHVDGNPFDVEAQVEFVHEESGTRIRTGMFYAGEDEWKFRFTGTRLGTWTFVTHSQAQPLDGHRGTVTIEASAEPDPRGFVSHRGNRWMWSGNQRAFVPQLVMYRSLEGFANDPATIDQDLSLWFEEHGFNGLHIGVACRWFDFDKDRHDQFADDDPNPDPRTFEALELLITKTHAAGGFVHIWMWGDEDRRMTPLRWGINGKVDRRLQRYLAARLGPLPGWTMGYGFDLWEWVEEDQLVEWHRYLHQQLGWPHLVGGRVHQHGRPLAEIISGRLDYVGFETHRPDYATYAEALRRHPDRPVFMEDRFRVRNPSPYPEKDYDQDLTRRGLWHSAMAGGVANIWGYLDPQIGPHDMSQPYPNRQQILTNARFFARYFAGDMVEANQLSPDGVCLASGDWTRVLIYQEDAGQIQLELPAMPEGWQAVAVDTRQPYREIPLGRMEAGSKRWQAPHHSDWALVLRAGPGDETSD